MTLNIDLNAYQNIFDSLLQQLSQEVNSISASKLPASDSYEDREHYLLAVNSFYYRSFIEKFCPDFKNTIKEEVAGLLNLARQEGTVKRDIMASLQRYAKLYNHCKRIAALLDNWRLENQEQQQSYGGDLERYSLELYYALKNIHSLLAVLQELLQSLNKLTGDQELVNIVNRALIPLDLLNLSSYLDAKHPLLLEHLNYLLVELHKLRNSLTKIPIDKENSRQLAEAIRVQAITDLAALIDKSDKSLLAFYQRNILEPLRLKAGLLSLYEQAGSRVQIDRAAQDFELYLNNLLLVLERVLAFRPAPSRQLLPSLNLIALLKPGYAAQLLPQLDESIKELNSLINDFPLSGEADFAYFAVKSQDIISKARPWLDTLAANDEISLIAPLNTILNRVELELSFLQTRLEFLSAKQTQSALAYARLSNITQALSSYYKLIMDIQADLERLLAPRNLSRAWKDLQLKVEHITLEKGRYFPGEYIDLLDKYQIETRLAEQESNIILYEEGDLFIIKVEDLREEEMPYLVVSQQRPATAAKD